MWGVDTWTWKDRQRPEARELLASGGRGSSSWDLYEEDLLSRPELFRVKVGTVPYHSGTLSLSQGFCKSA